MRYLWWAEFQKRGAIHYHMVVVDAPFSGYPDARHWFDDHWRGAEGRKLAGIQTWVDWKSAEWFRTKGGDYVLKDVRKLHGKRYEQDYDRMPRGWRTFRSHQLTFSVAEHQEHESKAWTVCTSVPEAPWHEKQHAIWIYRVDRHVPARDGCRLTRRRVRRNVLPSTTFVPVHDSLERLRCVTAGQSTGPPDASPRLTPGCAPTAGSGPGVGRYNRLRRTNVLT